MRRPVLLLTAIAVLVWAPAAWATRYASPSGSGTACSSVSPCSIGTAIGSAPTLDEEVVVEPGDYTGPDLTNTVSDGTRLNIHGVAGQPRPVLHFTGGFGLRLDSGSSASYLEIDTTQAMALFTETPGVYDQLIVRGTGAGSAVVDLTSGTVLRNSIVVSSGTSARTINTECNGCSTTSTLRNVTAIATGSGASAVDAAADSNTSQATINATNVVARALDPSGVDIKVSNLGGAGGTAQVHTTHSNYATVNASGGASFVLDDGTKQSASPLFVSTPMGDFHELTSSPTVDAGVDGAQNGPVDVDGDPRAIGTTDIGADEALLPPAVTTGAATGVGTITATLAGVVNPRSLSTTAHFVYGTTTAYGSSTPEQALGSGSADVSVSAPLTGLAPATTYHYRVAASSAGGAAAGTDMTFTTASLTSTTTPPSAPRFFPFPAKLASHTIKLRGTGLTLRLRCTASSGTCAGTVRVSTRGARKSSARSAVASTTLAAVPFSIPARATRSVKGRLTRAGRKRVGTARRLAVNVRIDTKNSVGTTRVRDTAVLKRVTR